MMMMMMMMMRRVRMRRMRMRAGNDSPNKATQKLYSRRVQEYQTSPVAQDMLEF